MKDKAARIALVAAIFVVAALICSFLPDSLEYEARQACVWANRGNEGVCQR